MMAVETIPQRWRVAMPMTAVVVLALLWWYRGTAMSIVDIWYRSGTYAHGFLIVPISAWLIWLKRRQLAALTPRASWWPVPIIGLLALAWAVAHTAEVQVVQQLCLVGMVVAALIAMLGWRVIRVIAFPVGFLFLAVPMGDGLIDPMMHFTAVFTVKALQLTGIPVLWEGTYITLPNGQWQVAAACSGVRYLIASITLGFLYAYLTYSSWVRRGVFIVLSAIVPVIANGMRAYMIVMIGYLSGMKLATGVDHIIYGWLFFGLVIGILFFIGSRWREDPHADNHAPALPLDQAPAPDRSRAAAWTALAVTIAALVGPLLAARAAGDAGPIATIHLGTPAPQGAWQLAGDDWHWHPRYIRPQGELHQVYRSPGGAVGLYLEYYRDQRQGAELIDSENVLVYEHNPHWRNLGGDTFTAHVGGRRLTVRERHLDSDGLHLLVWQWYWIGGHATTNDYVAKVLETKDKLIDHQTRSAAVMVATDYDLFPDAARRRLAQFLSDMYPQVQASLNGVSHPARATVTQK